MGNRFSSQGNGLNVFDEFYRKRGKRIFRLKNNEFQIDTISWTFLKFEFGKEYC